tara:strand:- start:1944 stop:4235 length:2292 start_codon:yes stop_codon:yes gene_type:complete
MKGTFFSADFVKHSDDSLRLLELNTDTTIVESQIDDIDWSPLFNIIDTNNITELAVIHKPYLHQDVVDHLSASVIASASYITTMSMYEENIYSLYALSPDDSDSKFILRLAYDEGAVFDSSYCKDNIQALNLFTDYNSGSLVTPYYHSSSTAGDIRNTLDNLINPANVPDAVVKLNEGNYRNPLKFYKIGQEDQNNSDRWSNFVSEIKDEDTIIQQFNYNSSAVSSSKMSSIRSFNIVYGSNLDIINLLDYKVYSSFELPTDLSSEYNASSASNLLDDKHYFEFSTNFIKFGLNGLYESHSIYKADDSVITLGQAAVGDSLKSYFISGSPQVEQDYIIKGWSVSGSTLPSGSYVTASSVVFKDSTPIKHGSLVELLIDDDPIYCGTGKQFLIYDSGSDQIRYELAGYLNQDTHYLVDVSGSIKDITEANFYLTPDTLNIVELDLEDTDTYIISGSTDINGAVSHNAPCFVAGTKIETEFGEKNIEDIDAGDIVLTYNHATNETQYKEVRQVCMCSKEKTVVYVFDNNKTLEGTFDHPLYCPEKGYVSYKPNLTSEMYDLVVEQIEIGDNILTANNEEVTVIDMEESPVLKTVYNLKKVEDNHNFFANGLLAHNRCFVAGTEVKLSNGDTKNIEDIIPGDSIISFNEDSKKKESREVTEVNSFSSEHIIKITLADGTVISSTDDHPYYVDGYKLASVDPDSTNADYDLPDDVIQLSTGDFVYNFEGDLIEISSIEEIEGSVNTFIITVDGNHNFYANSILVHNK